MYMHKEGVNYYRSVCSRFSVSISNFKFDILNNPANFVKIISDDTKVDFRAFIKELIEHLHNIYVHINSQDNKINMFLQSIKDSINGGVRENVYTQFLIVLQKITELERLFKILNNQLQHLDKLLHVLPPNRDEVAFMIDLFESIYANFYKIKRISEEMADSLKKVISTIERQDVLIAKERQFSSDFEKNIQSWL